MNTVSRTRIPLATIAMAILAAAALVGAPAHTLAADAVFIVGSTYLGSGDAAVNSSLQGLGFTVTLVDDGDCSSGDATGQDLVVISATVKARDVAATFRDVAVPVLLWEKDIYDDMDLTTALGTERKQTQVAIVDAGHAMAAGLSVTVTVLSSSDYTTWGTPTGEADVVATVPGYSTRAVLWGYETGAIMVYSFAAPARRVGVFLDSSSADKWTADGQDLFEAAVTWATAAGPPANNPPTADAGPDQEVNDADDSGGENVTLDGSASDDSDGTVVSY